VHNSILTLKPGHDAKQHPVMGMQLGSYTVLWKLLC